MAGHSKWANIKHKKAAQDAKRGKIFTKLIREITVSAGLGGGEPASNPRLRAAVDKALSSNMTKDTIERAIKRGVGGDEGRNMEEVRYEGYGPGGVAVIADCLTDNRNRTVSEVRHAFTKHGGNLGTDGSVSYLFSKKGQIIIDKSQELERVMELAIEYGADEVEENDDGSIGVETTIENYLIVKNELEKNGIKIEFAEITMSPATEVSLDMDTSEKVLKLIDRLEDLDDVQEVYTNADFNEDAINNL